MLQIARGIRSRGKPITDIAKASFIQAGTLTRLPNSSAPALPFSPALLVPDHTPDRACTQESLLAFKT
ncbi:hypothetical protein NWI01_10330 [Nitrobacter winogradskyi]|uniref:Uncharacterized protein n=1 Tax=Nitrobacter winogradskyi TaxID=913 RepID=A0A4Y3WAK6_NITWI|nr:hypothetical protein NWI01_10330 [Nitrobacter winogradskyi]